MEKNGNELILNYYREKPKIVVSTKNIDSKYKVQAFDFNSNILPTLYKFFLNGDSLYEVFSEKNGLVEINSEIDSIYLSMAGYINVGINLKNIGGNNLDVYLPKEKYWGFVEKTRYCIKKNKIIVRNAKTNRKMYVYKKMGKDK